MNKLQLNNVINRNGPLVLIILDGMGLGPENEGNALNKAHMPVLSSMMKKSMITELQAHGTAVGLPDDSDMGNSEVGHNALGAGRVFSQGAKLVNEALRSGDAFRTELWSTLVKKPVQEGKTLHLLGLLSDGNVHSHIEQLYRIIEGAGNSEVNKVRVHILLDGRDVSETSSLKYVAALEDNLEKYRSQGLDYRIASGGGRMITTMDRYEADWTIVERGWQAHVLGEARGFPSATEAIETFYKEDPNITDQYLPSFTVVDKTGPIGSIEDGDSVILFNFRGDRAIEISRAFDEKEFTAFDRKRWPQVTYAGIMQYDGDLKIPGNYLVQPPAINETISEYLVHSGIRQFATSETQKFGHVTYFWNGNRSGKFNDEMETYIEIPSDKIEFNQKPEMKAREITDEVVKAIDSGDYDFIRLNFANGDMVGHTGDFNAAIKGAECVDECLERIMKSIDEKGGIAILTADHGNMDEMFETDKKTGDIKKDSATGKPKKKTSHTLNPVPFIIYDPQYSKEYQLNSEIEKPGLGNVASTLLLLMGFNPPQNYLPPVISLNE